MLIGPDLNNPRTASNCCETCNSAYQVRYRKYFVNKWDRLFLCSICNKAIQEMIKYNPHYENLKLDDFRISLTTLNKQNDTWLDPPVITNFGPRRRGKGKNSMPKHVHKYHKVSLQFGMVWACALPNCYHYMPMHMTELVEGRASFCWKCEKPIILDSENMNAVKPVCTSCRIGIKLPADIDLNELAKLLNERKTTRESFTNDKLNQEIEADNESFFTNHDKPTN